MTYIQYILWTKLYSRKDILFLKILFNILYHLMRYLIKRRLLIHIDINIYFHFSLQLSSIEEKKITLNDFIIELFIYLTFIMHLFIYS